MTPLTQIAIGFAGTVAFAAAMEVIPVAGGEICLGVSVLLLIAALARGRSLPLSIRVFATGFFFYYGYSMTLVGRTMEPGLTRYTVGWALFCFGLFALVPSLSLLRLWRLPVALALLTLVLPGSFGAALLTAEIEERSFVLRNREFGIGPTARWTVSHHWLSYDREEQKLYGSD